MTEAAAPNLDSITESIFSERERLVSRTAALDRFEKMFADMSDEDISVVLDLADVFMRAAQLRMQKLGHRSRNCGGKPCGER